VARLQILQLPEGAGDDRPPYVLVIDEAATGPDGKLLIKAVDFVEAREATNARDVFIFEETVTIPANDVLPLPLLSTEADDVDAIDPELADLVMRTLGIELTPGGIPYDEALHNACRQLEKSEAARRHLNRERDRDRHRIAVADGQISRVRALITERRTEVAEFEAENKPSGWSDAVTVTCDRVSDALRVFPPSAPVPEENPS
jgi:hypothetical protein